MGVRALLKPDVMGAVLTRPHLWRSAIRATRVMIPARWWRRAPFLPLPDRRWLHFRLVTAYGGDGSTPIEPRHVVAWLEWEKAQTGQANSSRAHG